MRIATPRRWVGFFTLYFFLTSSLAAPPVPDMGFDIEAPVIQHDPVRQAVTVDKHLVISARVTDASGVSEVELYYRVGPVGDFQSVAMESVGDDQYSVTLPDELSVGNVEYYVKATDTSGNVVSQGNVYTPLTVAITEEDLGLVDKDKKGSSKTLWWAVGGALVLGVAALALGGGGGSSGGSSTSDTGTVTFGGATPASR